MSIAVNVHDVDSNVLPCDTQRHQHPWHPNTNKKAEMVGLEPTRTAVPTSLANWPLHQLEYISTCAWLASNPRCPEEHSICRPTMAPTTQPHGRGTCFVFNHLTEQGKTNHKKVTLPLCNRVPSASLSSGPTSENPSNRDWRGSQRQIEPQGKCDIFYPSTPSTPVLEPQQVPLKPL